MLYLDYAATSPLNKEVYDAYIKILNDYFANADAIYTLGMEVETLQNQSRSIIAQLLDVAKEEVIFTSGATESNNIAIKGIALKYLNQNKHLITTTIEHPSVLETFKQLEHEFGFRVTYLNVDSRGNLDLEQFKKALDADTVLVSIMYVNNETGSIMPINEIKTILKDYPKIVLHVDAVQAIGKINVDLKNIDLVSISAHKIYGLKGSGLLIKKQKLMLSPLIIGGGQESGIRSGTSNAPVNIVLAKTLRLALDDLANKQRYVTSLNLYLREQLGRMDSVIINSNTNASPYILNVSILGYRPEVLVHALATEKIYIATRSACSTKKGGHSHVLTAMNVPIECLKSAIRISLSDKTTKEELELFIKKLKEILEIILPEGD